MFNAIDRQILELLGQEGRMSVLNISKKIGVPNSTVTRRINRMIHMGFIKFHCNIAVNKIPFLFVVFVGIVVSGKKKEQLDELSRIPHVINAGSVTGRYDYIVLIAATSRLMLQDIIDNKLYKVEGVQTTESFVYLEERDLYISSDIFNQIYEESTEIYKNIRSDSYIENMINKSTI